jgi:hypothetical protein
MEALQTASLKADFCSLKTEYLESEVTDNPSVMISWDACKPGKLVDHYLGDHGAPAALLHLENGLDAILRAERWVGTKAERAVQWGEVETPLPPSWME